MPDDICTSPTANTPTSRIKRKYRTRRKEVLHLENVILNCRNILRGKSSNDKQRDIILTLVFIKSLSENFEGLPSETERSHVVANHPKDFCCWERIINLDAENFALSMDNVVKTINQTELLNDTLPPKLFSDSRIDGKVLKSLALEIDKIDNRNFHEKDLIGRVYEYFLQAFSINATKEEGEFYTPHSIVETIAALLEPWEGIIYDPCCGAGGMFIQAVKIAKDNGEKRNAVQVYGQESNPVTWRLAKMNLAVRGIPYNLGKTFASTFQNDQHPGLVADYIMANPPFNLKKWRQADELISDSRWNGYSVPAANNANYAWILHILSKLNKESGTAGFLLTNKALNDGENLSIRSRLIENDKIEAIIVLPREMFYTTDISVTLWILNNNKNRCQRHGRQLRDRRNEVLFVDLRTWNGNIYEKNFVEFSSEQITRIAEIYHKWQYEGCDSVNYAEAELYRSVSKQEIADNGYSLIPSRYIEFIDREKDIDYEKVLSETSVKIAEILACQQANTIALQKAFAELGYVLQDKK